MQIPIFHVDAFTDQIFSGNPAAVCLLEEILPDAVLQNIVYENNLPATAFLRREREGFAIRWFTPQESAFCGHGTLASAYVVFNFFEPQRNTIQFYSKAETLLVQRDQDLITITMQAKKIEPQIVSTAFRQALGVEVEDIFGSGNERCVLVLKTAEEVENLRPDFALLKTLNFRGFVFTAPSKKFDFVSRTFYPDKVMTEDPVTGASHRLLAPYWAKRLDKNLLQCYQASERGGFLTCRMQDGQVLISSKAVLYMQGVITLK